MRLVSKLSLRIFPSPTVSSLFACHRPVASVNAFGVNFLRQRGQSGAVAVASKGNGFTAFKFERASSAKLGINASNKHAGAIYSRQYVEAFRHCDAVVRPHIPFYTFIPNHLSIRALVHSGEKAAQKTLPKCRALAV